MLKRKKSAALEPGEMILRYTQQPSELPTSLRGRLATEWPDAQVELYAFVDLAANLQLAAQWLVLMPQHLVLAKQDENHSWNLQMVPRQKIKEVKELVGLSCIRLVLYDDQQDALAVCHFSQRQRKAVSHIQFTLERGLTDGNRSGKADLIESTNTMPSADTIYQRAVLESVKEAQASVVANRFAVIWRLLSYLKPYRARVLLGLCVAIAMTAVSLLPPFLAGYVIDHVLKPFAAGQLSQAMALKMAWWTIAVLAGVYILREFFAWIRLKTMSIIGEYVAKDLRNDVYAHLHELSMSYFSSKQTGSLISRVSSDTDRIWDFIAIGMVEVSTSIMMLVGLAIVLISMDAPLGIIVVIPLPVVLWLIFRHGQNMQRLFLRAWRKWSMLTDILSDTIPGIRVVKAFHQGAHETRRFVERNEALLEEFTRIHRAWTGFWPLLMLGIQAMVLAVWIVGVPRVLGVTYGMGSLTAGVFVSFIMYMAMFVQPIEIIGQMARMVNRATSSAHRVFEVLDTKPQVKDPKGALRLTSVKGRVAFEDVTFSYDGVRSVLKNVSFEVRPGEMVGLVGASGSGKSTITQLMVRFYDPSAGRVCIDGTDLRQLDCGLLRKQIGMVLQDPYLFHGSILDNIRYAKPHADLGEVLKCAKAANAHDFIVRLPHAYDTIVGERGHTLSGGERQRISIARAILGDPRVLILDEATSAVDTETEHKIQQALDRLVEGRTVIAIAHRLSTLNRANRLLVMSEGCIVENGNHQELSQRPKGVYANLLKMQQKSNELLSI